MIVGIICSAAMGQQQSNSISRVTPKPYREGRWLPSDSKVLDKWLDELINESKQKWPRKFQLMEILHPPTESEEEAIGKLQNAATVHNADDVAELESLLHKPVRDLMNAILTDPEINMFFHEMFRQQFHLKGPTPGKKVRSWQRMILLIDHIMTTAPRYEKNYGLVGFPINAILNWPMDTTAGFAAFLNEKVNRLFKNILDYWQEKFLSRPESRYVLNDDPKSGWFGRDAMNSKPMRNFVEEFQCNPHEEYYGFKSWDDFFTREFRPGIRPVEAPEDDKIVVNACESAPFRIARHVKRWDFFWIKKQRYSLEFMLNNSDLVQYFIGGTVYQAFLSATNYHRWHSPVSGIIHRTERVDGSYYSENHNIRDDPSAPNMSQGYLCQVAARAIIYIKANNPHIGLMCFIAVGMAEVSSTEITVHVGDAVNKGDQLGMFHYGGSTHCLIFRPEVDIKFEVERKKKKIGLHADIIKVNAKIATVN